VSLFKIGCLSNAHLYKLLYIIYYILSPNILVKSSLDNARQSTSALTALTVAPLLELVYKAYSPKESPDYINRNSFPPFNIYTSPFLIIKKESA